MPQAESSESVEWRSDVDGNVGFIGLGMALGVALDLVAELVSGE